MGTKETFLEQQNRERYESEVADAISATEQPAVEKPNLGLPWTLKGSHPWRIMCETNISGVKNVVATVAYRPMAELIVRSVNQSAAFAAVMKNAIDARLKVPVEFLVDGKRQAFAAGAEVMYNEITAALAQVEESWSNEQ